VYTYPGVYTVNLTVSNERGIASKTAVISVLSENNSGDSSSSSSGGSSSGSSSSSGESNSGSRSSGGSSSGSGGGAGSSPEPAKNVEAKEISQTFVTKGIPVKFDFTKNATSVVYISFDAKKTAGKITTIVEMLKNKSSLVSELPEDETYKSFNIWVGNSGFANAGNLENAVICFRVDKSWIQDKKINQSSIILNRYSEKKWKELPAYLLKQDDRYLYFTARTPGFSPFAITGKTIVKEANNEVQPATVIEIQPEPDIQNSGQYSTEVEKRSGQNSTEVELKPEKDKSEVLSVLAVICLMACLFVPFVRKKY
jgi:PGF-pre-PGF domain-containing protein